jgi:Protein of unknown function (DUF3999)
MNRSQSMKRVNPVATNRLVAVVLTAAISFTLAHAAESDRPEDYALRYTLEVRADSGLQRLALPAAALAAARTADRADVRVFNSNGQVVPFSIAPQRAQLVTAVPMQWPIYLINATPSQQQNLAGLQLRIEERAGQRTVSVDTGGGSKRVGNGPAPARQMGALVDTKTLSVALENLIVDAELPVGLPVPITIAASRDLKSWRTIVDSAPVFRFGGEHAPSNMLISLSRVKLDKEYLRITWPPTEGLALRGVQITPASETKSVARVELPLAAVSTKNVGEFVVSVPFATPLLALNIRAASPNVLVPVRIFSRNQRADPWRAIGSSVVYRMTSNGVETSSPSIELGGISALELRIEADKNTAGFGATPPTLSALVDPVEVAFLATGAAPFTLAVGRADAKRIALPLPSLIPGYAKDAELALPQARVIEATLKSSALNASAFSVARDNLGAPSNRSLALWAVLLSGVLLLGGIAWAIFRQTKVTPAASNQDNARDES